MLYVLNCNTYLIPKSIRILSFLLAYLLPTLYFCFFMIFAHQFQNTLSAQIALIPDMNCSRYEVNLFISFFWLIFWLIFCLLYILFLYDSCTSISKHIISTNYFDTQHELFKVWSECFFIFTWKYFPYSSFYFLLFKGKKIICR